MDPYNLRQVEFVSLRAKDGLNYKPSEVLLIELASRTLRTYILSI